MRSVAPDGGANVGLGTVVLVHGLGRTPWSMAPPARAARRHGYAVVNWGYPSRRGDVAAHAAALEARLRALAGADFRVVRRGHTFVMRAPEVHEAVLAFLAHGRFDPEGAP